MPKTASKRAQARKEAKVYRAHQTTAPERTISRRTSGAPSTQRRANQNPTAWDKTKRFLKNYPLASTIFVVLLIGFLALVAHQQQILFWAPPSPPAQATCNKQTHVCTKAPLNVLNGHKYYTATIKTAKGDIVIQLDAKDAPNMVNSFVFLAQQGFYNGLDFWKVERLNQIAPETNQPSNLDFIQGGKGGDGQGGPGYTVKPDATQPTYAQGTVVMVNASQFFINTLDNSAITSSGATPNPNYVAVGYVVSGLNVAKEIARGDKILSITITSTSVAPPTPTAAPTPTTAATATP